MIDAQISNEAKECVKTFNKEKALELVDRVIASDDNILELLNEAFIPAITEIGELFSIGRMFLPELIQAAEVMKTVTDYISEKMPSQFSDNKKSGVIVLGTVEGDVHDIGKTLVITLLGVNGFEVYDLGRDVQPEEFIDQAIKNNADIIGTSALLTTTMLKQEELEKALEERDLKNRFKTIVGGAPVTRRWAEKIDADGYGEDAHEAVVLCKKLLE